ncbi:MAG: 6-phosphofructokinase [Oscillospiraceae bacterium]|nr:6-phosphofructokinase [Oscillospiraceae bacterium]
MNKNLIIAHGGGPTAVINASLFGVIDEVRKHSCFGTVFGAVHGIEGILNEQFVDFSKASQPQIDLLPRTPSSAIGSSRRKLTEDDYSVVLEVFKKYKAGFFLYNGGNDSMDTCAKISRIAGEFGYELTVAGIPKTIDNDLAYTDHSPGYGSAARFIVANTRDLRCEERALPIYPMIIEVMGRNAGWLAAAASLAEIGGKPCADLIYLPEYTFDERNFLDDIDRRLSRSSTLLVVVSEGLVGKDDKPVADTGFIDGFGHSVPGGTAQALANLVLEKLGVQTRYEKLGLVGRASEIWQSSVDRREAIRAGRYAVKTIARGISGYMVTIRRVSNDPYRSDLGLVPLGDVANVEKKFPLEWINSEHNGVSYDFAKYGSPIIGDNFTPYTDFDIETK